MPGVPTSGVRHRIPQIVAYPSCFRYPLFFISSLNSLFLISIVSTRSRSRSELPAGTDPLCSSAASCQGLPLRRIARIQRSR